MPRNALRDDIHEQFAACNTRVQAKITVKQVGNADFECKFSSSLQNDFCYKCKVAGFIALCNTIFATFLAVALRNKLHEKLPRVRSAERRKESITGPLCVL